MEIQGLTIPEAAKKVGVSPHTVRKWCRTGAVSYSVPTGRTIIIEESSLMQHYDKNKAEIVKFSRLFRRPVFKGRRRS